jgi:uncharacterized membrane protein YfcA
MDVFALTVIFTATFFGAMYGTLVGGASLLTIPTLIFFGVDPHVAAGTNRLGIIGLPLAGWYKFHQKKLINYKVGSLVAVFSATGAIFWSLPLPQSPRRCAGISYCCNHALAHCHSPPQP